MTQKEGSAGKKERRSRTDRLVQTDPTALYSYEEYEAGADAVNLVDASEIDISVMGRRIWQAE